MNVESENNLTSELMKPEVLLVITLESEIMEKYKENFDDDVRMMEKYGSVDPQNGDFLPFLCRGCDGPLLGHIAEQRDCQGPKISNDDWEILNDRIRNNDQYDVQLKFLDKRPSEIHC